MIQRNDLYKVSEYESYRKKVIIYKIIKDEITVLRVFNQKENYLNLNKFILREESQNYFIIKSNIERVF